MKYEIGSFSVDGEHVGGCEDEGETVDIGSTHLQSLCYDRSIFQLPSALLPPVYWSFGSDETIIFFLSKHINTWNGLCMALLILYEVHEQTVWTQNIRFKASRQRDKEKGKNEKWFIFFSFRFSSFRALSVTTWSGVRCKQTHETESKSNCSSAYLNL